MLILLEKQKNKTLNMLSTVKLFNRCAFKDEKWLENKSTCFTSVGLRPLLIKKPLIKGI